MKKLAAITAALLILLCGCGPADSGGEEPEGTVDRSTYQSFWMPQFDHKVMPVAAFIAPPVQVGEYAQNFVTDEQYRILAESGINTAYGLTEVLPGYAADVREALRLSEKHGISYVASVSGLHTMRSKSQVEYALSALLTASYPALGGVIVRDEPSYTEMERIAAVQGYLGELLPGALYHTNLFPDYATQEQLWNRLAQTPPLPASGYSYGQYLSDFLRICTPQVLSYDNYPMVGEGVRSGYFENMSAVRSSAAHAGIPFLVYIQTCSYHASVRVPNRAEILWMVNSSLAYGAKGIQYFTYFLPNDGEEHFRGAMIDRNGSKTPIYGYVQEANRQIAAVDEVLMRSISRGVVQVGSSPCPVPEGDLAADRGALTGIEGRHLLVGVFDYRGRDAYYVLNNSIAESDTARLSLDGSGYAVRGAASSPVKGAFEAELEPGEGVLIVLD